MQHDKTATPAPDEPVRELSVAELDAESAAELPDREAMTIVSTDPVDPPATWAWPGGVKLDPPVE